MTNPRDIITLAVQKMHEAGEEYCDQFTCDSDISRNLAHVKEFNVRGKSICGNASRWLEEFLPSFLEKNGLECSVFTVTSSVTNGCFHHFNMVKVEEMEPVICDLTASQYFNKPLTALKNNAYFVGTRDELRGIITATQQSTWEAIYEHFPEREFRSLWDVDFHYYNDWDFRESLNKFLDKETPNSCLRTESFYYPMSITWGSVRSHLLNRHMDRNIRAALTQTFQQACIADLTEDKDPEIENLITTLSSQNFSLKNTPQL